MFFLFMRFWWRDFGDLCVPRIPSRYRSYRKTLIIGTRVQPCNFPTVPRRTPFSASRRKLNLSLLFYKIPSVRYLLILRWWWGARVLLETSEQCWFHQLSALPENHRHTYHEPTRYFSCYPRKQLASLRGAGVCLWSISWSRRWRCAAAGTAPDKDIIRRRQCTLPTGYLTFQLQPFPLTFWPFQFSQTRDWRWRW